MEITSNKANPKKCVKMTISYLVLIYGLKMAISRLCEHKQQQVGHNNNEATKIK